MNRVVDELLQLEDLVAGKKAERFAGDDANQLSMQLLGMLLAEGETPTEEAAAEDDDDDDDDGDDNDDNDDNKPRGANEPNGRRRGRRKLPEALPRVEIEVLPPEVIQGGLEAFERIGEVAVNRAPFGTPPPRHPASATMSLYKRLTAT
jgi:transposase